MTKIRKDQTIIESEDLNITGEWTHSDQLNVNGGLGDFDVTSPISLGDSDNTELNTVNKTLTGSINEMYGFIEGTVPTSLYTGVEVSIDTDPTKYIISPGYIDFRDVTVIPAITTRIYFPGQSAKVPPNLLTRAATYIYIDKNGTVYDTNYTLDSSQTTLNTKYFVGSLGHPLTTIIEATSIPEINKYTIATDIITYLEEIGLISKITNAVTYNGANLFINKGVTKFLSARGPNYYKNKLESCTITSSQQIAPNMYRFLIYNNNPDLVSFDVSQNVFVKKGTPTAYGVYNDITAANPTDALKICEAPTPVTIHRVYEIPNVNNPPSISIGYGQNQYATLDDAETALLSGQDSFVESNFTARFPIIGFIAVLRTATDLSNAAQARFINGIKIKGIGGGYSSGGGGSSYIPTTQQNIIYFSTASSSDIGNGFTLDSAKQSPQACIDAASLLGPSVTNQYVCSCIDGGAFSAFTVNNGYIHVFAPASEVISASAPVAINDCKLALRKITNNGIADEWCLNKFSSAGNYSSVEIDEITGPKGVRVSAGTLKGKFKRINASSEAILVVSGATAYIEADRIIGQITVENGGTLFLDLKSNVGTTYSIGATATINFAGIPKRSNEFYVSKDGNDTFSGKNRDESFLTINKAITAAEAVASGSNIVSVHIASGTYVEKMTLNKTYINYIFENCIVDGGTTAGPALAILGTAGVGEIYITGAIFKHNNAGVTVFGSGDTSDTKTYLDNVSFLNAASGGASVIIRSPVYGNIDTTNGRITITTVNSNAKLNVFNHKIGDVTVDAGATGSLTIQNNSGSAIAAYNYASKEFTLCINGQTSVTNPISLKSTSETYVNDLTTSSTSAIYVDDAAADAIFHAESISGTGGITMTAGKLNADIKNIGLSSSTYDAVNLSGTSTLWLNANTGIGEIIAASGSTGYLSINDMSGFTLSIDPASNIYFSNPPINLIYERWAPLINAKNIITHISSTTRNLLVTEGFSTCTNYASTNASTLRLPDSTSATHKDAVGTEYTYIVEAAQDFECSVTPSDNLVYNGVNKSSALSANMGDILKVKCMRTGYWVITFIQGTWTIV